MKRLIEILFVAVMLLSLTSCATIFAGGSPKILLEGNVDEPVTITTDKQVYKDVTLPAMVEVKRHKIDGKRIKIESPNFVFQDIVLQKKIEGWTWGNIAIGGIIGWCVDMATNCVSKPKQTKYEVNAQPRK
jgi:hypothetical protein